jgi:hypothetical protein
MHLLHLNALHLTRDPGHDLFEQAQRFILIYVDMYLRQIQKIWKIKSQHISSEEAHSVRADLSSPLSTHAMGELK